MEILHASPRSYRINRSNWSRPALAAAYSHQHNEPISSEDLLALGIVTEGSTNLNDGLSSVALRIACRRQRLRSTRTTSPERKRQTREIRTGRPPGAIDLTMAIDLLIAVLWIAAEPGDSGSRKQSATR